jgi:hypothetical protein
MNYLHSYKLHENINLAKSVLRKKGLETSNEEYQKILSIVGKKLGWVGFLTKLHFVYNVDIVETEHIFNTLISNSVDLGKVSKMNYTELSDYLYELEDNISDQNFKFIFTDNVYNYFEIYDYEGILKTGSPSWCLKTKSNWDNYLPDKTCRQFVIIKKGKKLLTPDTNYFKRYENKHGGSMRYGITFRHHDVYIFDDNNKSLRPNSDSTISHIYRNVDNYIRGKEINKVEIEEKDGLVLLGLTKRRNKIFYIPDQKALDSFYEQNPFIDLYPYKVDFNQDIFLIGISGYTTKSYFVFNEYERVLISDDIYTGFTTIKYTGKNLLTDHIKIAWDRGLIKKVPLTLFPTLASLGVKSYDKVVKDNDTIFDDNKFLYRTYINKDNEFVIQQISKEIDYEGRSVVYYFWRKDGEYKYPKVIMDMFHKKIKNNEIKETFDNTDTLARIWGEMFPKYLEKINKNKGKFLGLF